MSSELTKRVDAKAALEKREALKRILGYDAASASQLSRTEIRSLTKSWMRKSGAVGGSIDPVMENGDELYNKLVGLKICKSDTIIGCLAFYWKNILKVIREEDEELSSRSSKESVYMMLFPYCKDLYMYDKLSMLNSAVDLGQDMCQHLGFDFSLTMFHPKYKNAPTMFSPERHSPFPTAGLQFSGKKLDCFALPTEHHSVLVDNQRVHLERLFNAAAAFESHGIAAAIGGANHVSAVPYYSSDEVVETTKEWFDAAGSGSPVCRDDTLDGKWFVSTATIAEEAYADIWAVIHNLHEKLKGNEKNASSSVFIAPRFSSFNACQWRQFAITVNAVLKRVTNGKIVLEVFHPEYTGTNKKSKSNNDDNLRRSPFPTIHISSKMT